MMLPVQICLNEEWELLLPRSMSRIDAIMPEPLTSLATTKAEKLAVKNVRDE